MRAVEKRVGSPRMRFLGIALLSCGLLLMWQSPSLPVLAVPGVALPALGWWLGLRREKFWVCGNCHHAVERRYEFSEPERRVPA
jgi:hypothetical protein